MKKTLSILMIVAMLFSMVVAAIPAGAAAAEPVTVLDPDKVGNVVITDENREDHIEELLEEGYIPLANNVWADYEEIYGEGVVKNFNSIFDGGEDIADGGKFFLIEDVVASKTFRSNAVTKDNGQGEHWVDNFTLDGCGYSITVSKPLFEVSNNITFKNITFKGTIGETKDNCGSFSVTNKWEQHGEANFENVTSTVTLNINNRATSQKMAALTISASNSEFKNIKIIGDHTLTENATIIDGAGAIVGIVHGDNLFENCYVEGNTYVNAKTMAGLEGLGGLCGVANGKVTFKNCVNKRNIVISEGTTIQSQYTLWKDNDGDGKMDTPDLARDFHVGGIIGRANEAVLENCVNEGTITFAGKFNVSGKVASAGGLVGTANSGLTVINCENKGALNLTGDNSFEATKEFEGSVAKATIHHNFAVGGVVGAAYNKVITIKDTPNNANILLDRLCTNAIGGVVGYITGTDSKVINCDNNGDITFQNGAKLCQPSDAGMAAGGVIGLSKASNLWVEDSDNMADLVFAVGYEPQGKYTEDGKEKTYNFHTSVSGVGGVMGYQYQSNAESLSIVNCDNNGTMTEAAYATKTVFVGGILGGARGVNHLLIDKCTNEANIATSHTSGWSGVAGIIGEYGSIGNWMSSNNPNIEATVDIRGCVNNGNISANASVGGIMGENGEVQAVNLKTTFYACVNNGTVTTTGKSSAAGGIYGTAALKGALDIQYCTNNGAVTAKSQAGGIVGTASGLADATIRNSKNTGAVKADTRAGGIASTATTTSSLNIISCFNSGAITVTAKADGVAAGILGYSTNKAAKIDKNVNSGKISNADDNLEAPITVNQVTLASGVTNYYLSGCVAKPSSFKGTSKDQNGINTIVNGMVFAAAGDPFHLNKSIKKTDAFIKSDYVTATWTAVANALTGAKNVAGNIKSTQEAIDNAKKALDDAIAGLDPKDLDLTEFNKKYAEYKALDKSKYDGNSYLEVKRAVEAAEIIKDTENALQSVFDKAVALIGQRISELQDWKPPKGDIDVDAWGDMTVAPLHTTAPATQPTTPPTEATTPAPTTAATEPADEGCGGLIGGAAIVATAVLALGAGISLKKKED